MAQPIASVVTMSGIHRTNSGDVARVLVDGYHKRADGGVLRVDFDIEVNGSYLTTIAVSSRSNWQPDDTDLNDPISSSSGPVVMSCYGIELALASYAAGIIRVTPKVVPTTGTTKTLDIITIYNDTDGTNRSPCTSVAYVSPTGNNANPGTLSQPVQSIQKAMNLLGNDVGGGKIYLLAGTHQLANSSGFNSDHYTSGNWWLTIEPAPGLTKEDVTIIRHPDQWLNAYGTSTSQSFRVRFRKMKHTGLNIVVQTGSNVTPYVWCDGVESYSAEAYKTLTYGHVGFYDSNGGIIGFNNSGPAGTEYYTGTYLHHRTSSFAGARLRRGCKVDRIFAIAINDFNGPAWTTDVLVSNLEQYTGTYGYVETITGNLEIVKTGDTCRLKLISGATPDYASASQCGALVGLSRTGITVAGFTGSNNGTFLVTATGYQSGVPYVEYVNASGSTETSATTGSLRTGRYPDGQTWNDTVHSDIHQIYGSGSDIGYVRVRAVNTIQGQGFSCNGFDLNRVAIIDCSDGKPNSASFMNSYLNGNLNHVIIRNSTFVGTWNFDVSSYAWTDCEVTNNVFVSYSGTASEIAAEINCSHNHFNTGLTTFGSSATSGTTFANSDPGGNGIYTLDASCGGVGTALDVGYGSVNRGVGLIVATGAWGAATRSGSGGVTLRKPTISSSGILRKNAVASITLPKFSISSSAFGKKVGSGSLNLFVPTLSSIGKYVEYGTSAITLIVPVILASGPSNRVGSGNIKLILSREFINILGSGIKGITGTSNITVHVPTATSYARKVFNSAVEIVLPIPFLLAASSGSIVGRASLELLAPEIDGEAIFVRTASAEVALLIPQLISSIIASRLGRISIAVDSMNTQIDGSVQTIVNLG